MTIMEIKKGDTRIGKTWYAVYQQEVEKMGGNETIMSAIAMDWRMGLMRGIWRDRIRAGDVDLLEHDKERLSELVAEYTGV